jgi:hypothetical protein
VLAPPEGLLVPPALAPPPVLVPPVPPVLMLGVVAAGVLAGVEELLSLLLPQPLAPAAKAAIAIAARKLIGRLIESLLGRCRNAASPYIR